MWLFDVPDERRVRITSKQIRYADCDEQGQPVIKILLQETTWTGTTTSHYWIFEEVERRLIVNHTIECEYLEDGIWQRNCECHVIG